MVTVKRITMKIASVKLDHAKRLYIRKRTDSDYVNIHVPRYVFSRIYFAV